MANAEPRFPARGPRRSARHRAFDAIDGDSNNELVVGELEGRVVAVLQLTCIPNISRRGSWRALIEGVRVDSSVRSGGVGRRLVEWAIERAREKGCHMVQLTSDKRRRDAIRFYESSSASPLPTKA